MTHVLVMFGWPGRLLRALLLGLLEPGRALVRHRELFLLLLRRDLSDRTAGTIFGFSWVFIQPALQVLAFWFLLDLVLQIRFPGRVSFVEYFLVGMLAWLMLADAIARSTHVLTELSALYQRMRFPIVLLPMLPLTMAGLIFGGVYTVMAIVIAGPWSVIKAPLIIFGLMIWLLPWAYLLAVLGLFLRDIRQLVPFALTMLLFLSPILYTPDMLPEGMQFLLSINPIADLMAIIHHVLLGTPIEAGNWLRPWLLWLLLLGPAWIIFRRAEPHLREAL